eukprot:1123224-Prymnesium_polylepis.1
MSSCLARELDLRGCFECFAPILTKHEVADWQSLRRLLREVSVAAAAPRACARRARSSVDGAPRPTRCPPRRSCGRPRPSTSMPTSRAPPNACTRSSRRRTRGSRCSCGAMLRKSWSSPEGGRGALAVCVANGACVGQRGVCCVWSLVVRGGRAGSARQRKYFTSGPNNVLFQTCGSGLGSEASSGSGAISSVLFNTRAAASNQNRARVAMGGGPAAPKRTPEETARVPLFVDMLTGVLSGATAATCAAPFIMTVDKAVTEVSAGKSSMATALARGLSDVFFRPHQMLTRLPFWMVAGVYGSTYATANTIDAVRMPLATRPGASVAAPCPFAAQICERALDPADERSPFYHGAVKLFTVTAVNMSAGVAKDVRTPQPRPERHTCVCACVQRPSYALGGARTRTFSLTRAPPTLRFATGC